MTSDVRTRDVVRDAVRTGVHEVTAIWWWFLILGIVWTGLGMFVLSYRVGSLAAVAGLVGVAFLTAASPSWWWQARYVPGAGCSSWPGFSRSPPA
jgi:hypothetical protein